MFVRSAFNFDAEANSNANAFDTGDEAITQQSFKEDCDINVILKRFAVTGELPDNVRVPQYVDFEETFDFMSSMNVIRAAEEAFAAMPAVVRDRFNNDPAKFVEFANDASNYDEALKLGLVVSRPISPDPESLAPSGAGSGASSPGSAPVDGAPGTSST